MENVQTISAKDTRIPGPRAWPVLGNLGVLKGFLPFLEEQWALHGDVFRVRTAGLNAVVVANPEQIQQVLLSKRQHYAKGSVYEKLRKFLGNGLVTLEGDAWRARRNLAQPAFHRQSLERLAQIMVRSGARYFDQLTTRLAGQPTELDVHREMTRVTMDVVINALFGLGTLGGGSVSYETMGEALELLSHNVNGVPLPSWVPTPHNIKFRRTVAELDRKVYDIIRAGRERGGEDGTLLSMLLDARDEAGQALTDQDVRDEVLTLFLAGHETTALTLTWMFVLLADQPHVLARMRDEVDEVLDGRDPGFADVPKLAYVRKVIDETLRLRPPAAMVGRNAIAEDDLGGYRVMPGEIVLPFIWAAHRHPTHWQHADRFDPERFSPANNKGRHLGAYAPFALGPRICIGNTFSLVEMTILVAQMLLRYELAIRPAHDVKPVAIGTVRPSRPVLVEFRSRVDKSRAGVADMARAREG